MRAITITNQGYDAAIAARPPVERAWIYRPETEWGYSHHPVLTFFNGRYYLMWSNGRKNEDAPGQRVLLSTSADFRNWTPPAPLVDSQPAPTGSEYMFSASGFHSHAGRLVAYVGRYAYLPEGLEPNGERKPGDAHHTGTALLALSTTDGEHWSEPAQPDKYINSFGGAGTWDVPIALAGTIPEVFLKQLAAMKGLAGGLR